jgi:predicted XRE-type DNA-binding protein
MKKNKSKFPSDKELLEVEEALSNGISSRPLSKNASNVDRIKHTLCEKFVIYRMQKKISQKELASLIGTDEALMSKILHYHYDEFTVDRLVRFIETLQKDVEITIKVA